MKWLLLLSITSVYAEELKDPCGRTFDQAIKDKAVCANPNYKDGMAYQVAWNPSNATYDTYMTGYTTEEFLNTHRFSMELNEELILEDNL